MEMPAIIRNRLLDLERRFTGPIPRHMKFQALLPAASSRESVQDINDCIEYCRWMTSGRWLKLKWAAKWAIASKGRSGLSALIDRERFRISADRLQEARYVRAAWIKAKMRKPSIRPNTPDWV